MYIHIHNYLNDYVEKLVMRVTFTIDVQVLFVIISENEVNLENNCYILYNAKFFTFY